MILNRIGVYQKFNSDVNYKKQNLTQKNNNSIVGFTSVPVKTSLNPTVALVEKFDGKVVDIDGDNIPDLSHGDLLFRMSRSIYPEASIKKYAINSTSADPYEFDVDTLCLQLNKLSKDIAKGEKISAVNLSLSKDIDIDFLRNCSNISITRENLSDKRAELRNWFKNPKLSLQAKTLINYKSKNNKSSENIEEEFRKINNVLESIESITRKGVPVYTAAGNKGPEFINIFNIANGVIPVGANNTRGEILGLSGNNSLVNRYEQGIYNVSEIQEKSGKTIGYDITGSGKTEVKNSEVSGQSPAVKPYLNKNIKDVMANDEDYLSLIGMTNSTLLIKKIRNMPTYDLDPEQARLAKSVKDVTNYDIGVFFDQDAMSRKSTKVLFPINGIANIYKLPSDKVAELKSKGNYVNASLNLAFKINKAGTVIYDPDKSGRQAINEINGTSLSVIKAWAKDLKNKFLTVKTNS